MAICGYNEKIGEGLRLLVQGMVDALNNKAATRSSQAVLAQELVELDSMITVLQSARGEVLPEMFVGLNVLARALFCAVQQQLLASGEMGLSRPCVEIGERFIDLLKRTEAMHVELRSAPDAASQSVDATARRLAGWALSDSRGQRQPTIRLPETVAT